MQKMESNRSFYTAWYNSFMSADILHTHITPLSIRGLFDVFMNSSGSRPRIGVVLPEQKVRISTPLSSSPQETDISNLIS